MAGDLNLVPATKILVPKGTTAISYTATSLYEFKKLRTSGVTVTWNNGSGLTQISQFLGPTSNLMLTTEALGLPLSSVNGNIPSEINVSFNIDTDATHQHSVSKPVIKDTGGQGTAASFVQISAYESADKTKAKPITFTIQFIGKPQGAGTWGNPDDKSTGPTGTGPKATPGVIPKPADPTA
jgi:hypothetical protein